MANKSAPDRSLTDTFCDETLRMLDRVEPRVRELVRTGGRHDDPAGVLADCFALVHSLHGSAASLHHDRLAAVAAAAEHFVRELQASPDRPEPTDCVLLHEVCTIIRQGIGLVDSHGSDEQLHVAADDLAARLLPAMGEPVRDRNDDRDLETFIGQADGLMQVVERELLLWDLTSVEPERLLQLVDSLDELTELFARRRYGDLERICRAMGNVLRRFHGGEVFQGEYPDKVFLGLVDVLYEGIDAIAAGGDGIVPKIEQHLEALQSIMRQPIGELLIQAGLVDPQTVEQALRIQEQARAKKKTPKRLGDLLVAMGEVSTEEVDRAIRTGRACPVGERSRPERADHTEVDEPVPPMEAGASAGGAMVAVDRESLRRLLDRIRLLEPYRAGMDASLERIVTGLLGQAAELARRIG